MRALYVPAWQFSRSSHKGVGLMLLAVTVPNYLVLIYFTGRILFALSDL